MSRWGAGNHRWKDDFVGYSGAHHRVRRRRGSASSCVTCGRTDPAGKYQWGPRVRADGQGRQRPLRHDRWPQRLSSRHPDWGEALMPRRVFTVYATTEQDARDIAERRARDARLEVTTVDEVIELDEDATGLRPFVVWVSVK